jgi:hypothetical protein
LSAPLGVQVAAAAVIVTARNAVAVLGLEWAEVAALAKDHGIEIRRAGRRPYVLVADVLGALDGKRARPWTPEDTRAELAAGRCSAGGRS